MRCKYLLLNANFACLCLFLTIEEIVGANDVRNGDFSHFFSFDVIPLLPLTELMIGQPQAP